MDSPPPPSSPADVSTDVSAESLAKEGPQITPPYRPSRFLFIVALTAVIALITNGILGFHLFYLLLSLSRSSYGSKSTIAPSPSQKSSTNFSQLAGSPTPTLATGADIFAGWKTYTNPKYPFNFKYPTNYTMEENSGFISILSPLLPATGKGYELKNGELKVEIYIQSSPVDDSLEKYASEKKTQTKENLPESKILNEAEIIFQGIRTVLIKWEANGTGETRFLIKNGYRIGITKYPLETSRQVEFDQILSTFQFLDQNSNPEGRFCGGIAANLPQNQCPEGYTCKMEDNYPDASGFCTKEL